MNASFILGTSFQVESEPYAEAYISESVDEMTRIGRMFAKSDSNLTYLCTQRADI